MGNVKGGQSNVRWDLEINFIRMTYKKLRHICKDEKTVREEVPKGARDKVYGLPVCYDNGTWSRSDKLLGTAFPNMEWEHMDRHENSQVVHNILTQVYREWYQKLKDTIVVTGKGSITSHVPLVLPQTKPTPEKPTPEAKPIRTQFTLDQEIGCFIKVNKRGKAETRYFQFTTGRGKGKEAITYHKKKGKDARKTIYLSNIRSYTITGTNELTLNGLKRKWEFRFGEEVCTITMNKFIEILQTAKPQLTRPRRRRLA